MAVSNQKIEQNGARIVQLEQDSRASLTDAARTASEVKHLGEKITRLERVIDETSARLSAAEKSTRSTETELTATKARLLKIESKLEAYEERQLKVAEEASKKRVLVAQLGITMRSGETKPIANNTVYLLRESLLRIAPGRFESDDVTVGKRSRGSSDALEVNAAGALVFEPLYQSAAANILSRITANAVRKSTTDFSGRVSFDDIEPGEYFILCITPLAKGAVLEKQARVEGQSTFVALDNASILENF